ncbi:hypothetical protein ACFQ0T_19910 [Kitasatospora gansuensis]
MPAAAFAAATASGIPGSTEPPAEAGVLVRGAGGVLGVVRWW